MSTLPTIRIGGAPSPEDAGAPSSAPGKTSKLPVIRIGGDAPAPGKTSKIPDAAVPAPEAAPAEEVIDVIDVPADEVIDIIDVDPPTPAEPASAPAEPNPEPAKPVPVPEAAPVAEPVPEQAKPVPAPGSTPTPKISAPAKLKHFTSETSILHDDDSFSLPSERTMRGGDPATLGRIDHYDLLRKLGGGGFGVVYLARDTASGVEVALKTLHPLIKRNAEEIDQLRDKFALISRLAHPNIATTLVLHPVRDINVWDDAARDELKLSPGDNIMIMRYAPGVTLSKWRLQFPNRIVPLDQVLEIGRQVAIALDYAHDERIVHRDVKPSNIMVETLENGRIRTRILDFGLAAEIRSSMSHVSSEKGDTSGTYPYMAPEQWNGKKQDGRTDQYALACVLYELLSGAPPLANVFATGDPMIMKSTVQDRIPDAIDTLPSTANAALLRSLAKNPNDRFSSCVEFVEALGEGNAPILPDSGKTSSSNEQSSSTLTEPVPAPETAPAAEPVPALEAAPAAEPAAESVPAPAEPAPAPAEPTPTPSKTGLRPGLKLPPRVGGASTKRRVPVRTGAGLKLPPKPGAAAPAAAAAAKTAASPAAPASDTKAADAAKKPDDKGKKPADKGKKPDEAAEEPVLGPDGKPVIGPDGKPVMKKKKKRSLFVRLVRQVPNLLILLAAMTATAWLRVAHFPPVDAPPPRPAAPAAAPKKAEAKAGKVSPWIRTAKAKAGKLPRIVHAAPPAAEEEPVAEPEEPVVEEVVEEAPKEPKKKQIVKRVPADLFEDALLETVKMLRTMPQADACRAAVNSFSDIANKERERSRECYRVITALNSAKNWDDLVADTIFDNPKKREITVGTTKHVIFPTGTVPGAVVCKRYVKDTVLLDQRIALADMSPQEKLRILRSEKPDPSPSALYGRALLELVYGSPKTFKAFVDKHKRIEGMKAFYVVYELERLKQ